MMNEIAQQAIADKVLKAVRQEDLLNKDAANLLGVGSSVISFLGNKKYHRTVSSNTWKILQDWVNSGKRIRECKANGDLVRRTEKDPEVVTPDIENTGRDEAKDLDGMRVKEYPPQKPDEFKPEVTGDADPVVLVNVRPQGSIPAELIQKIVLDVEVRVSIKQ